jgi:hypothetical protein
MGLGGPCCLCFGDSLDGGDAGGEFAFSEEFVEELGGLADGFEFFDGGSGSEGAEGLVVDDLFDEGHGFRCGRGAGKVEARDLQAVEEQAGAARVEVVGGDAFQDLADRELDGGAVLGHYELEGAEPGLAGGGVFHRAAGGVVEVAELLVAEADTAATAAFRKNVAALVGLCFVLVASGI